MPESPSWCPDDSLSLWSAAARGRRVGGSTGTNLIACLAIADEIVAAGETGGIVTLLCDGGERYACTYYDDDWLADRSIDWKPVADRIERKLRIGR